MPTSHVLLTFICALSALPAILTKSHSCADGNFSIMKNARNITITNCKKLGALDAEIGWEVTNATTNDQMIHILFGAHPPTPTGWVAWGVNPLKPQMVGTRAFIAFMQQNRSIMVLPYYITDETKHLCQLKTSKIDLVYTSLAADYSNETGFITMSVTLSLSSMYSVSGLNHVWQVGTHVIGTEPRMHATTIHNFDSRETIDLMSADSRCTHYHRQKLRKVHGIVSMIGWGIILPLGIISARYLKEFPFEVEKSYAIHVPCQICGFVIGTIGWALGMSLGNQSKNYILRNHRIIGITIFSMALLQVLALWLRPKKKDDFLKYWRIYHHFIGYALFTLIVVNIFKGIDILSPSQQWKWAYRTILAFLGLIVLFFESITWGKFIYQYFYVDKEKLVNTSG
ncbi:cytochrome b561 and DOMON domain-containing protein At5g47530-like [Magnolia sinica]|uniref:cytochrome b561 and DOMON domain-containing protein At5g47530-like n=1 Tax=Magnolia sinica TaxID=86752 RepID=UPI002659CFBA|nr:cytochrome b561 and DOMON domain-containing protein At5g47530-like [Magnolia sinica]